MKSLHEYIHSKTARRIIISIAALIVVLLFFELGMLVGYKKGTFACRLSDNYFRIFGDERGERMGLGMQIPKGEMPGGHGATGKIVHIELPAIVVVNPNKIEKSIYITDDTIIKKMNETISASDLKTDDTIVVVGSANNQGQIEARLIRVLPPPPPGLPPPASTTSSQINNTY